MRISDWSSDVCSSDLLAASQARANTRAGPLPTSALSAPCHHHTCHHHTCRHHTCHRHKGIAPPMTKVIDYYLTLISPWAYLGSRRFAEIAQRHGRSEEHTSELQSLMCISYAVFCLTKKT